MNLTYSEWRTINTSCDVSYDVLEQAICDLSKTIDGLDMYNEGTTEGPYTYTNRIKKHLITKLDRLIEIKKARDQEPWRPWMATRMTIEFKVDTVEFQGLPDGPWSVPASERTGRLSDLIKEIYGESKSVKVESNG